ncbi:MAG TPA: hypothetical protein VGA88_12110 [Burkholderiales bacterium]
MGTRYRRRVSACPKIRRLLTASDRTGIRLCSSAGAATARERGRGVSQPLHAAGRVRTGVGGARGSNVARAAEAAAG